MLFRDHVNQNKAPHLPHDAPNDLVKMVKSELEALNPGVEVTRQVAIYQAMIRALDMGIEQVYNAAQTLNRETIIIFGSDNGATVMALKARVFRTFVPTPVRRAISQQK